MKLNFKIYAYVKNKKTGNISQMLKEKYTEDDIIEALKDNFNLPSWYSEEEYEITDFELSNIIID